MYFHIPKYSSFLFQQIFHLMFFLFFKRKKTPIDDVAPQSRSEIQYVISTLYRILGQNLEERDSQRFS